MPLQRITHQNAVSILDAYSIDKPTETQSQKDVNIAMTEIINRLNEHLQDKVVLCYTSLNDIILVNEDTWNTPKYVTFFGQSTKDYTIQYLMPKDISPWEYAYVRGKAKSPEQALEYILIAMNNSNAFDI